MDRRSLVVCAVVGFLGFVSALLGFIAEAKRIKGSQVKFSSPSECVYPRSPALALGLTAAIFLMISQVIINVATGCICCSRRGPHQSTSNWTSALVCFIVSWFTFVIAFLLLLSGAALNDEHGEENMYFGSYYCYVVKPGVFAGAASLSLVSVVLGCIYYVTLNSTKVNRNETESNQTGIVMGLPQHQNPVFVHEDTYARRQVSS
ncbi:protein VASCULATURE COMPLEXITY AND CONNECTIVITY [Rutidosis leptorrhynchoides]|uniref:protein VASCULATURE COMPLEXITY AND CONNECTIVITY n=1 Tax=Rutidosis leptorrhynchoides TaxID=125765 RepID=UPI003A99D38B